MRLKLNLGSGWSLIILLYLHSRPEFAHHSMNRSQSVYQLSIDLVPTDGGQSLLTMLSSTVQIGLSTTQYAHVLYTYLIPLTTPHLHLSRLAKSILYASASWAQQKRRDLQRRNWELRYGGFIQGFRETGFYESLYRGLLRGKLSL